MAGVFCGQYLEKGSNYRRAAGSPLRRFLRSWWKLGENGIIIFAPEARAGLYLIPAAGGTPRVLTSPDYKKGETGYRWPHLLPGGNEVLFSILMAAARTRCS